MATSRSNGSATRSWSRRRAATGKFRHLKYDAKTGALLGDEQSQPSLMQAIASALRKVPDGKDQQGLVAKEREELGQRRPRQERERARAKRR